MANNSGEIGRTKRRLDSLIRERDQEAAQREPEAITNPEPTLEQQDMQDAEPVQVAGENASDNSDMEFLQSVIDGTAIDILEPEFADRLTAVLERNIDNEGMADALEKAVMAYQSAAEQATADI